MACASVEVPLFSAFSEMATTAELTRQLDRLEERVTNNIKFFWVVVGFGFFWLGGISFALYNMNGEIGKLRLPQRLAQSSLTPTNPKNQSEVKAILAVAKRDSVVLPEPILKSAESQFINAAKKDPGAWEVVPDFLSYRSFLNASLPWPTGKLQRNQIDPDWGFTFPLDDRSPNGRVLAPGEKLSSIIEVGFYRPTVPVEEAAAIRFVDEPDKGKLGPKFIKLEGDGAIAIKLDGFHMRNAIFRKVIVVYRGGPTRLENVLFIDCVFRVEPSKHSQEFAQTVLEETPTSFQASD